MGGPIGVPRRPARQGTSRIVPVVVSAGLALGVFCGLLFGLGTGKSSSAAPSKASNNVQRADESFTPESLANPNVKIDKNAPKAGSNAVATGSAAPATGSNTVELANKPVKLMVEISPDNAARTAKVFVDGKEISGLETDIPLDPGTTKKRVKVTVKVVGYKDVEQETDLEGESVTVKLELTKGRSTQTAGAATPAASVGASGSSPSGNTGNASAGNTAGPSTAPRGGNTVPSSGGTKNTGGSKNNGTKSGKTGKGSGGLIDI